MGTEAIWIPLLTTAVAAGATAYNTNRTAKKQDNALAAQLRQQGERQREADAKVGELITKTGASSSADEQKGSLDQYMNQLRSQQGNATAGLNQQGAVSDAYKQSGADAALGINEYGGKVASLMSRMDAPGLQRVNEAIEQGRIAGDIDRVKRFAGGDDYLAKLKLQGIRRNPWIDAGAAAANGYASSYGSGNSSAAAAFGGGSGSGQGSALGFGNNMDNFVRWGF